MPFFSIVVATFNVIPTIEDFRKSINSQVFEDFELLISDGGSTDGTLKNLSKNPIKNSKLCKSSIDEGIYYALNYALACVTGDWIIVLGADDVFNDELSLMNLHNNILNYDNTLNKIFYTDLKIKSNNKIRVKKYPNFEIFKKGYHGFPPLHHQTVVIKNSNLVEFGLFDTVYKIHSDHDYLCRIIKKYEPIKINQILIIFNDSGYSSNFRNIYRAVNEIFNIRKKFIKNKIEINIYKPFLKTFLKKMINYTLLNW